MKSTESTVIEYGVFCFINVSFLNSVLKFIATCIQDQEDLGFPEHVQTSIFIRYQIILESSYDIKVGVGTTLM